MFFAKTPDELPTKSDLIGRSGLDFMTAVLNGELSGPPIADLLNFRLRSVEFGTVTFRGSPKFSASNPMGTVHGGWYGTVLDSALGCSVMTTLPKGTIYTTAEYKVNIIRGVPLGTEVDVTGQVEHSGRSTAVATAKMIGVEDGKTYAVGSTTCAVMTPKT